MKLFKQQPCDPCQMVLLVSNACENSMVNGNVLSSGSMAPVKETLSFAASLEDRRTSVDVLNGVAMYFSSCH